MRGVRLASLVLFLSLILLIPTAAARGGGPLGVGSNTLWAQYTNQPACCETWMGTIKDDPDFSGSGNYGFRATTPVETGVADNVWDLVLTPAISTPVQLDKTKTIDITLFLGYTQGAGQVDVSTTLTLGGATVAEGETKTVTFVAAMEKVTWSVTPAMDVLQPSGDLTWHIEAYGISPGTYMGFRDEVGGQSNIVLPIVGGGETSNVILEVLTGTAVDLSKSFDAPTTQTLVYTWNTTLTDPLVSFEAQVANGTIEASILDGANKTAYSKSATSTLTDEATPDAEAGQWQITVTLTDFQGNFTLAIRSEDVGESDQDPKDPQQVSTATGGVTSKSVPSSSKAAGIDAKVDANASKGSPGLAPILLVAALLLVGMLRRKA